MKHFTFQKIKEYRESAGMTQARLAELVGVMPQQISAWETSGPGKSMTAANLAKISAALGKTPNDFLEG